MKSSMRIAVLLDESTDLARLEARRGSWLEWIDAHVIDALRELGHTVSLVRFDQQIDDVLATIRRTCPDLVFNLADSALDDRGKDAYSAVMLELAGLPYTGASPRGLFFAGDKALSKTILRANGIDVPDFQVVPRAEEIRRPKKFPVLVKALNRGGSEGLIASSLVTNERTLKAAVRRLIHAYECPAICEEFIEGRELSVGIVGGDNPRVLSPSEWRFGRGPQFVTERLKADLAYSDKCGTKFAAVSLEPKLARRVVSVCRRVYRLLELRDYGSVDLRVTADGRIVVLDVNANPGLVRRSRRWKPIPFRDLIASIVRAAVCRGAIGAKAE